VTNKQIAMRRTPSMTLLLNLLGEKWGINNSAVMRIALCYTAEQMGFTFREAPECLVRLRDLAQAVRENDSKKIEKAVMAAEKFVARHDARLKRMLKFDTYPVAIERFLAREERRRK
jgi:hypothetical protein